MPAGSCGCSTRRFQAASWRSLVRPSPSTSPPSAGPLASWSRSRCEDRTFAAERALRIRSAFHRSPRSWHLRYPLLFPFAGLVVVALTTAPALAAQEHDTHEHGGGRLGRVVFPVSCTPAARRSFEHAVAGLHSFWWQEGDRAFGNVLAADSTCAMAWWGL